MFKEFNVDIAHGEVKTPLNNWKPGSYVVVIWSLIIFYEREGYFVTS